ncbi:MAG: universal stress protein [Pseudomonas sp.]|uniref:universal stress protein n=1 Tax=unclassified Pseudomonas TaxID=196821 RepID=UPI001CFB0AFA|nr:universal stress protein [Pseudomonas sp. L5B5]UCZ84411.1 universal stress protein [Pseudomonas sp. L5B5]
MSQYQRLLLIADPQQHQSPAARRAAALARASGARLHALLFVEPPARTYLWEEHLEDSERQAYLKRHERWLQVEAQWMREQGVEVTTQVIWSTQVLKDMLDCIAEIKPDLLIKDVTLESVLKRVFVTPLDCHLLRDAPVPVHLVNDAPNNLPRRIVAAVDPAQSDTQISGLNAQIIRTANALALQCDAQLHLLYAYDLMPMIDGVAPVASTAWSASCLDELRDSLHKEFERLGDAHNVPQEFRHFIMGPPVPGIAQFVDEYLVDAVVMGTVHRTGFGRLIGSTTERALYSMPGSILAVKSMDRQ